MHFSYRGKLLGAGITQPSMGKYLTPTDNDMPVKVSEWACSDVKTQGKLHDRVILRGKLVVYTWLLWGPLKILLMWAIHGSRSCWKIDANIVKHFKRRWPIPGSSRNLLRCSDKNFHVDTLEWDLGRVSVNIGKAATTVCIRANVDDLRGLYSTLERNGILWLLNMWELNNNLIWNWCSLENAFSDTSYYPCEAGGEKHCRTDRRDQTNLLEPLTICTKYFQF